MKTYTLNYREYDHTEIKDITVQAKNREDAYFKAADKLGWSFYSLWNSHYTTKSGKVHYLNLCIEGNGY